MAKLLTGTRVYGTATIDTQLIVSGTTASTSTTTGAFQVVGGAGIGGNLYVGGEIVAQKLTIELTTVTTTLIQTDDIIRTTNTTSSTSTTTGALQVAGGAGIGGLIKAAGISTAQQTITVNSTTTNLDFSLYDHFLLNMNTNTTLIVSNAGIKIGGTGNILIRQDATGGRTFVKATEMKTPFGGAAIAQVTSSNALSLLTYYVVDSSTLLVNYIGNFA